MQSAYAVCNCSVSYSLNRFQKSHPPAPDRMGQALLMINPMIRDLYIGPMHLFISLKLLGLAPIVNDSGLLYSNVPGCYKLCSKGKFALLFLILSVVLP